MRGIGDLFLTAGIILVGSGLVGILEEGLGVHRILVIGATYVFVGFWIHRHPRDEVQR